MPEVCRFHNIRIVFNSREHHNIEHFHVVHPDLNASVEIRTASILAGRIPSNFRVWYSNGSEGIARTFRRMAKGPDWRRSRQDSAANTKVIQNATDIRRALF